MKVPRIAPNKVTTKKALLRFHTGLHTVYWLTSFYEALGTWMSITYGSLAVITVLIHCLYEEEGGPIV